MALCFIQSAKYKKRANRFGVRPFAFVEVILVSFPQRQLWLWQ